MDRLTYKQAGVDIEKAESFVEFIKAKTKELKAQAIMFGSFASGVPLEGYKRPVIMMTTDGVGTKLKVAQQLNIHHTVGIDLVAMNVNDLITSGAEPLGFMDYIATGKLDLNILKKVIEGIVEGCKLAQVPLVGGETAEMPDFYPEGVYDLAGFCVGVCEENKLITGKDIKPGDVLIGLPSSGFHSNGYSLLRKVIELRRVDYETYLEDFNRTVGEILLEPTRIYWKEVKTLLEKGIQIKGMAHITGGGIPGNVIRILPEGIRVVVEERSIPVNPIFQWVQKLGNIEKQEMFRVFNMGVGFVLISDQTNAEKILSEIPEAFIFGFVKSGERSVEIA
ncbi:phosphoribosylformylglycinamidine cyclo-ligase [Thermocrinis sp.]